MKQLATEAIILARSNYGEADRIIIFLTKDHGKMRAIAKGLRKSGSKLAGSLELFSLSQISLVQGRGDLYTLISARLIKHYGNIVKDLNRTNQAYEFMKALNKATEDAAEPAYFNLLNKAFESLDNSQIDPTLTTFWFSTQLLKLAGHQPNLKTDTTGAKLSGDSAYNIDFDKMTLRPFSKGLLKSDHIKFLRLGFSAGGPRVLQRVKGFETLVEASAPIVQAMLKLHIRL